MARAMTPETEQARFWFVHTKNGRAVVNLAVAAFTERSARRQARKRVGPGFTIDDVNPVEFAHAWVIDHVWQHHFPDVPKETP